MRRRTGAHDEIRVCAPHAAPDAGRNGRVRAMTGPRRLQQGRWGYIVAWLIGVPVPILIVIYLLRGCT
jgi:hypothetical protein